jgi:iron complex outermembrane recepter protein
MRLSAAVVFCCLSIVGLCGADDVRASIREDTNIPAEGLVPALKKLAHERGFQLVFQSEVVGLAQTHGAVGAFSSEEALNQLLKGTGLSYRYLDEKTVTIIPLSLSTDVPGEGSAQPQPSSAAQSSSTSQGLWGNFLLAQATQGPSQGNSSMSSQEPPTSSTETSAPLQEVIVTAEKRAERLQDVPVPVTAISADALVGQNELRLQDYYATVPGLDVTPVRAAYQTVSIRGITTGLFTNPTVGFAVDGVPYGASTDLSGAAGVPDIDPSDLARIEVLRGPQGTLYGASSMGGLINYVTVDPSSASFNGRVEAGTDSVQNGGGLGYSVRGAVNVPLGDTLAARMSAFTREDPGYIDNPVINRDGVNEDHAYGGHFSGEWRPSETLSLKVSALFQETKGDGHPDVVVAPGLGDLQQNYIPGVGANDHKVQAYSAILNAKFGSANLTAITGYSVNAITDSVDYSGVFGPAGQGTFGAQYSGTPLVFDNSTDKFSQELRLLVPVGQRIDWLIGGFYTREVSSYVETVSALNPSSGQVAGDLIVLSFPSIYQEYAGFSDLTFHITDKFDVQVGGRETHIKQTFEESSEAGALVGPSPVLSPESGANGNAFTYLVTPRFKVSSSLMVYARAASGYRAGGGTANQPPSADCNVFHFPCEYSPDKTEDYEIGIKGGNREISFDTSLYYIDWKGIQATLNDPNQFSYTANGNTAKSQGVELSIESRPLQGLTITGWVAYDDAVLTTPYPVSSTVSGSAGDRLPYSSRISGSLSLEQTFSLWSDATGFVGGGISYVGNREGDFQPTATGAQRVYLPAYAKTDLRAGLRSGSWTVNIFANNVADRRGLLVGGLDAIPPNAFVYIQPRTVGVSVTRTF